MVAATGGSDPVTADGLEDGEINGSEQEIKGKDDHKDEGDDGTVRNLGRPTPFFVSNIPYGCSKASLLKIFEKHGDVFNIYVAKKKDKAGRIFGFVRYRNVEDVGLLESNLKNIMVEGRRLVVNLAKYDILGHKVEVATSINHLRSAPVGSGLPDLVSGFPPLHQNGGSNRPCLNALNGPWAKQKSVSIPPDTIAFSERYESSLVGSVIDFNTLCNIHTSIADAGFHGLGIKYLGGFVVLLTFPNPNEACVFLNKNDLWKFWFSSLDQWCGQSLPFERVAWIRVLGVPAHLWDRSVINLIGNQFGKVIQGSQISWGDNNWSQECIGILFGDGRQIKEELELTWRDNSYRVWIIEEPGEWIPDCLRPITTPKDPYAKDCYRTKSSPVDNFGTEHGTADVSSSGGPRNLVGSASEKPYGDSGKAVKCDLANKIEIQPTCISPREHSFFDSQPSKGDGEMCQLKKQVGGPIGNKRSTPSKTPGPFIFCAATSNPKRARSKSSSPTNCSSPLNPFTLSFIPQSKKRSRIDSDPSLFEELLGLNIFHNPVTLDLSTPKPVDLLSDPNLSLHSSLSKKQVEALPDQSKVSRKVGKKNGLGESKKTGDYDYGKGGSNKGGDNPIRKTKRKAKSSCVKDGKVPAPSTLPKPGYMYPPSYPP